MPSSPSFAISALNARLQLRDLATTFVMVVIPLVFVPFLLPGAQAQSRFAGFPDATGAEQVVPGLAVLFGLLTVQQVCMSFFREYEFGTWDRLRSSPARTSDIIVGKVSISLAAQLLQFVTVLVGGALLFGYRPNGSIPGIMLVSTSFAVMVVAFGVMLVALFKTLNQALVIGNILGMMMACVGGAFGPVSSLPEPLRIVALGSPAYWALDSMSRLSLNGASLVDVLPGALVVLSFGALFSGVAALRFHATTGKVAR